MNFILQNLRNCQMHTIFPNLFSMEKDSCVNGLLYKIRYSQCISIKFSEFWRKFNQNVILHLWGRERDRRQTDSLDNSWAVIHAIIHTTMSLLIIEDTVECSWPNSKPVGLLYLQKTAKVSFCSHPDHALLQLHLNLKPMHYLPWLTSLISLFLPNPTPVILVSELYQYSVTLFPQMLP